MEYTYSDNIFSDLYKDVYGVRPRGAAMDDWNDRTPRQKQELWPIILPQIKVRFLGL